VHRAFIHFNLSFQTCICKSGFQNVLGFRITLVKVAEAFGLTAFAVERREDVDAGLKRLLATDGPVLMHVKIDSTENVWPLVPPGAANHDMMDGAADTDGMP